MNKVYTFCVRIYQPTQEDKTNTECTDNLKKIRL